MSGVGIGLPEGIATDDKAPWVVAYDSTTVHGKPPLSVECRRCLSLERFQSPIPITEWVTRMKAFARVHRKCAARPTPPAVFDASST